jgi:hypothetical protein
MAQYADQFVEARSTTSAVLTLKPFGFDKNLQDDKQREECFICGKSGHKAGCTIPF